MTSEASKKEKIILKEWMDKDPDNQRKYEAIRSYWTEQNYDLCKDKIFNNVKRRISEDKRQKISKRLKKSKLIPSEVSVNNCCVESAMINQLFISICVF